MFNSRSTASAGHKNKALKKINFYYMYTTNEIHNICKKTSGEINQLTNGETK